MASQQTRLWPARYVSVSVSLCVLCKKTRPQLLLFMNVYVVTIFLHISEHHIYSKSIHVCKKKRRRENSRARGLVGEMLHEHLYNM